MRITRRALGAICVGIAAAALFGCGGGGGGAPPAIVIGKVAFASSGVAIVGVTVTVGGVSGTTAADGSFRLDNVPSTATQLTVTGSAVKTLTVPVKLVPEGSGTAPVVNDLGNIYLLESNSTDTYTANLSGQVVRQDTFAPIAGATVTVNGQAVTTDASGNFTITGLPVGLGNPVNPIGVINATGFLPKPIDTTGLPLGAGNNPLGAIPLVPSASSTTPGLPSNIMGKISLQGQTDLSGTTVTLINKAGGATVGSQTTDASGNYGFYVAAGSYTVKAVHAGPPAFQTQSKDVTLDRPDHVQTVNMTLVP